MLSRKTFIQLVEPRIELAIQTVSVWVCGCMRGRVCARVCVCVWVCVYACSCENWGNRNGKISEKKWENKGQKLSSSSDLCVCVLCGWVGACA